MQGLTSRFVSDNLGFIVKNTKPSFKTIKAYLED